MSAYRCGICGRYISAYLFYVHGCCLLCLAPVSVYDRVRRNLG